MSDERIYPNRVKDRENFARHIARYKLANMFIKTGGKVLDVACGAGYGSSLLGVDNEVLGIDKSEEALAYANKHYANDTVHFQLSPIEDIKMEKDSFDAVVCLETIEHLSLDAVKEFIIKSTSWIKVGGVLILSSPMLRYKDGKPYVTNPYHINELPKEELLRMLNYYLPNGYLPCYFHQEERKFVLLNDEDTGFLIMIARRLW